MQLPGLTIGIVADDMTGANDTALQFFPVTVPPRVILDLHHAPPAIEGYQFFDFYEPARQVGGDYYDYIRLPGERLAVVVADVQRDAQEMLGDDSVRLSSAFQELEQTLGTALTPEQEQGLLERHLNRVTDTCIPEEEAMRRIEDAVLEDWMAADRDGQRYFPHEFMYRLLLSGRLADRYQIDPKDSWLVAAAEKNLPMFVPGWEDSTLGNMYAAHCIDGDVKDVHTVRTGIEYMIELADWYTSHASGGGIGFFQIGGGIAGDFPICVVPMLHQDLKRDEIPVWSYFCQISDSTTSYGSYSGAVPNEKITWGKLAIDTPKYIIESDATVVAPLVFALVLGW